MIKTIIFDLGNVIIPFDFKRAYSRLQPLCDYPASEIPARMRGTDLISRFESGKIPARQFVQEFSALLELRINYEEFCDLWTSIFLPEPLIQDSLLANLSDRYPLMILSNTNPIHFEMIKSHYPLMRHFRECVLSYEVGALKPHLEIYGKAVERAGCRAAECFFTDDLAPNVEAARKLGMDAVQFQSAGQLEDQLKTRGLL
ncbi:MAG TPA: HAD family phosphatase [Bryobacteraceae bacterium]|nr:HAD family phosphatase [Bryobacteraceae bacterium]